MDFQLPSLAREMGQIASRAFAGLGGVDYARRCEADPELRNDGLEVLASLGAEDVKAGADHDQTCAAAELCRVAGRVALPLPIEAVLARSFFDGRAPLMSAGASQLRAEHADLGLDWVVVDLHGGARPVDGIQKGDPGRLGPFVIPIVPGPELRPYDRRQVALVLLLQQSYLLGLLEAVQEMALVHAQQRSQFGRPLAEFQAVRMHLADMEVAVRGLKHLVSHAVWSFSARPNDSMTDALAGRLAALRRRGPVLDTAHLLHGAIGFCDEHDLSILDRHGQARFRIPTDLEATAAALVREIGAGGFANLFSERDAFVSA